MGFGGKLRDNFTYRELQVKTCLKNPNLIRDWGGSLLKCLLNCTPAHGTTGYASDGDRGIALPGNAPWVMLYANTRDHDALPEHFANIGFVVRAFEADLGAEKITTPHINLGWDSTMRNWICARIFCIIFAFL